MRLHQSIRIPGTDSPPGPSVAIAPRRLNRLASASALTSPIRKRVRQSPPPTGLFPAPCAVCPVCPKRPYLPENNQDENLLTLLFSFSSPLFLTLFLQALCSQRVPRFNGGYSPTVFRSTDGQVTCLFSSNYELLAHTFPATPLLSIKYELGTGGVYAPIDITNETHRNLAASHSCLASAASATILSLERSSDATTPARHNTHDTRTRTWRL
jgi:hypothetical protein